MSAAREALATLILAVCAPNQRVINYMSYQATATEAAASLRVGNEHARQWMSSALRVTRDMVGYAAEAGRPISQEAEGHALPADILHRLVLEVAGHAPARLLFKDTAGRDWTAEALAQALSVNPALASEYSNAVCACMIDMLRADARHAPAKRRRR